MDITVQTSVTPLIIMVPIPKDFEKYLKILHVNEILHRNYRKQPYLGQENTSVYSWVLERNQYSTGQIQLLT